jgi:hypothetical protein
LSRVHVEGNVRNHRDSRRKPEMHAPVGRVAALGEANLPIFSHFCGIIGFAEFPSDRDGAESVSAVFCTEHVGGRAEFKTEL